MGPKEKKLVFEEEQRPQLKKTTTTIGDSRSSEMLKRK